MSAGAAETQSRSAVARIARNGALSATAEILSKIASLVLFALLAREFGQAALGDYVFAMAIASLIWSLTGFGLDRMTMRDVARDPTAMRRLVVPLAAIKVIASLAATAAVAGVLALAGRSAQTVALVAILGANTALGLGAATVQAVFAANERMEHVFLTKVPWAFAASLSGIAVLLAGGGIVAVALVSSGVVAAVGAVWAALLMVRLYGRPDARLRMRTWPGLLRLALPFGLQEMLGQVIFRFDTVLLGAIAASAVVGDYGAAYRMLEATLFIAWSVGYAVMPMYSYLRDDRNLTLVYEGSLKLALALMVPIAVTFAVCARAIVDLVYGLPEFEGAVSVLRLLAVAVAVYSIGHLAGILVLVRRPGRYTVAATAVVALFNVVACAVLIPWLGANGAAIATLASESLLALAGVALAVRVVGLPRFVWVAGSPLLAAASMAAAMWPLRDRLELALPAGALAYLAVLAALEARRARSDLAVYRSIGGRSAAPA